MNNVANNVFLFAYPIECPLIHECLLGGRKVETDSLAEDGKGFGWMFWVFSAGRGVGGVTLILVTGGTAAAIDLDPVDQIRNQIIRNKINPYLGFSEFIFYSSLSL